MSGHRVTNIPVRIRQSVLLRGRRILLPLLALALLLANIAVRAAGDTASCITPPPPMHIPAATTRQVCFSAEACASAPYKQYECEVTVVDISWPQSSCVVVGPFAAGTVAQVSSPPATLTVTYRPTTTQATCTTQVSALPTTQATILVDCCPGLPQAETVSAPAHSVTPNTRPLLPADCNSGHCGATVPPSFPTDATFNVNAVQSGCKWLFGATCSFDIRIGVCYADAKDICSGIDDDVTKDNFCTLVSNFLEGGCFGAGGVNYGCKEVSRTHENTHLSIFTAELATRAANLENFALDVSCPDYDTKDKAIAARTVAIRNKIDETIANAWTATKAAGEAAAYASEFPKVTQIADSICQRADTEGWEVEKCAECVELGYPH